MDGPGIQIACTSLDVCIASAVQRHTEHCHILIKEKIFYIIVCSTLRKGKIIVRSTVTRLWDASKVRRAGRYISRSDLGPGKAVKRLCRALSVLRLCCHASIDLQIFVGWLLVELLM